MGTWKTGGCHCGGVRFKVYSGFDSALDCNCSICTKKGFLHLIVPREHFELVSGEETLTLYQFNTRTAKHYFCNRCGIAPFYVPRSHPEGYDVNLRCMDAVDLSRIRIEPFDGQGWEANIEKIRGYDS